MRKLRTRKLDPAPVPVRVIRRFTIAPVGAVAAIIETRRAA